MKTLISSPILQGTIAVESLVLYIQTILKSKINNSPEQLANLEIGAMYSLYSIRDINSKLMNDEKDGESLQIIRAKHKELYFYDYNVSNLFKEYVSLQENSWIKSYIKEKVRISEFLLTNTNRELNI